MSETTITILGSGTCVPSIDRSSCSVLVQGKRQNLLLDAGPGTIHRLLQAGLKINDLDAVFLSHFHLDHCSDIALLLFATKYPELVRRKRLCLVGGPGVNILYENMNRTYDRTLEMPESLFEIFEIDGTCSSFDMNKDFQVSFKHVAHKPESLAYRFTDKSGFCFVYSGDTDYSKNLIDLSKGADILICESAFPDGRKTPGHLTPSMAGDIAKKAGVKRLVLIHFYPECAKADIKSECRKVFKGEITLAEDLMKIK